MKVLLVLAAIIVGGSVFLMAVGGNSNAPRAAATPDAPDDYMACVIAEKFVTDRLKAPSTAKFPQTCREPDTRIARNGNIWTVRSWVDAQNEYGAMLRADTTVVIEYSAATDKWTLKDFQMETR